MGYPYVWGGPIEVCVMLLINHAIDTTILVHFRRYISLDTMLWRKHPSIHTFIMSHTCEIRDITYPLHRVSGWFYHHNFGVSSKHSFKVRRACAPRHVHVSKGKEKERKKNSEGLRISYLGFLKSMVGNNTMEIQRSFFFFFFNSQNYTNKISGKSIQSMIKTQNSNTWYKICSRYTWRGGKKVRIGLLLLLPKKQESKDFTTATCWKFYCCYQLKNLLLLPRVWCLTHLTEMPCLAATLDKRR